ncbi:hypothetical protein D3C81_1458180 [compost metagenome]
MDAADLLDAGLVDGPGAGDGAAIPRHLEAVLRDGDVRDFTVTVAFSVFGPVPSESGEHPRFVPRCNLGFNLFIDRVRSVKQLEFKSVLVPTVKVRRRADLQHVIDPVDEAFGSRATELGRQGVLMNFGAIGTCDSLDFRYGADIIRSNPLEFIDEKDVDPRGLDDILDLVDATVLVGSFSFETVGFINDKHVEEVLRAFDKLPRSRKQSANPRLVLGLLLRQRLHHDCSEGGIRRNKLGV